MPTMAKRRPVKWLIGLGVPVLVVAAIAAFWNWDWFVPMAQARVSAAIGRRVTIGHLHIRLGFPPTIVIDDVTVANPQGWQPNPPFAHIQRLLIRADLLGYVIHHRLNLPLIEIDHPALGIAQTADGRTNYKLPLKGGSGSGPAPQIGDVRIVGGQVHAVLAKLKANFDVSIRTVEHPGKEASLEAEAHGTYAGAPIEARMIGGALLGLRDTGHPWPVRLAVANGPTKIDLDGSVQDPLKLQGADLRLHFAGPSLSDLKPLIGLALPSTPPFDLTGGLNFADRRVQFHDIVGRVGTSDLEGNIAANPGPERPVMTADLHSRSVNLADLGAFVGAHPGGPHSPTESPERRAAIARAEKKSPSLLPSQRLSLPQFHYADVHLRYRGEQVQGRSMPLDDVVVALDVVNGQITLHPVSFRVGTGDMKANMRLTPENGVLHANADLAFQSVDVGKLMAATHVFHGAGTISGSGKIVAEGDSVAAMAANGNGEIDLGMVGGNLSALIVDLSGLEFGNALLSALGLPHQTQVECLVGDFLLQHGIMHTRALVLDTKEAVINGSGNIDLRNEKISLQIKTAPKHFSVGSLPGPIDIGGTMKSPSILPSPQIVARGAAAGVLAALLAPLAILPTIQFGTSDHHQCQSLLAEARAQAPGTKPPAPRGEASR
jgi:uncharacterized protein involved in outer membrane biogenesis